MHKKLVSDMRAKVLSPLEREGSQRPNEVGVNVKSANWTLTSDATSGLGPPPASSRGLTIHTGDAPTQPDSARC